MMEPDRELAMKLMSSNRFNEALSIFSGLIQKDRGDWSLFYMAGQCARFGGDLGQAVKLLQNARNLASEEPDVHQALGIALQQTGHLNDAEQCFVKVIELDPEKELAFNSLAMTQKLLGKLEYALHNYDAGIKVHARKLARSMSNCVDNPILADPTVQGELWVEYCIYSAMYLASSQDHIKGVAWPTGEMAEREGRTHENQGYYWKDVRNRDNQFMRLFLPNFFNTFCAALIEGRTYSIMIGNRGTILQMLGRVDEAEAHFDEAEEFTPA